MERRRKWAWPLLWLRFIFYSIFCFPSWTWRLSAKKLRNTLTRIVPVKFKALVQVTLWFCLNWLGIEASQALMCWSQCLRANCCSSFFNFAFSDPILIAKNQPCWEDLPHRNPWMLLSKVFFPSRDPAYENNVQIIFKASCKKWMHSWHRELLQIKEDTPYICSFKSVIRWNDRLAILLPGATNRQIFYILKKLHT